MLSARSSAVVPPCVVPPPPPAAAAEVVVDERVALAQFASFPVPFPPFPVPFPSLFFLLEGVRDETAGDFLRSVSPLSSSSQRQVL